MLLKKLRNCSFGVKKTLACVLVACITLTLVQSSILLSFANSSKTMIKTSDSGYVNMKFDTTNLVANEEYTISFKYHYADGSAFELNGGSSKDYFSIVKKNQYGYISGATHSTTWVPNYSNIVDAKAEGNLITLKVKFDADAIGAERWISFYKQNDKELYIADLAMYKSSDTTKTNLLPKSGDWVDYQGTALSNTTYLDYDKSLFDNMIKIEENTYLQKSLKLKKSALKADTEYTVKFSYAFENKNLKIGEDLKLMVYTFNTQGLYTTLIDCSYNNQKAVHSFDYSSATYKIKFTSADLSVSDDIHISLDATAGNVIYIADFVMYETSDINKENILPKNTGKTDWTTKYGYNPTLSYVPYDATLFVPSKMMIKTSESGYNNLKFDTANLVANEEYTISFKYHYADGSAFELNGGSSKDYFSIVKKNQYGYISGATHSTTWVSNYSNIVDAKAEGNLITLKVKFEADAIGAERWISFYKLNDKELYIADLTMYKSSDVDRLNLLPFNDDFVSYENSVLDSVEYLPYDKSKFEQMLKTSDSGYVNMKFDTTNLVADKEYTISFRYRYEDEKLLEINGTSSKDYFSIVKKNQYGYSASATHSTNWISNYPDIIDAKADDETVTLKVKFAADAVGADRWISFYKQDDTLLYVADLVMYASDDELKTNILTNGASLVSYDNSARNNSSWIPYDESLLNPEDYVQKMLHLQGGGYQVGLKLDKSKVTVGNTYTVRFDYNFNKGKFKYDYRAHIDSGDKYTALNNIATFNLFYDRNTSVGMYLRMFANVYSLGAGDNGYSYTLKHVDENTVEFTFKITNNVSYTGADGNYYVGFFLSQGDMDLYLANFEMFDTADTEKTNILPALTENNLYYMPINDIGMAGTNGYDAAPSLGLNDNSELLDYDETKLIPAPKGKQMLHLMGGNYQTGIKIDKSKMKAGKTYTVRMSYKFDYGSFNHDYNTHVDNGDAYKELSDMVTLNLFYDRHTDVGVYLRMFSTIRKKGSGTDGHTYKLTKIDKSTLEMTFVLEDEVNYQGADGSYYLGFWLSRGDIDLYVADLVMYDTSDKTKTNLLPDFNENNMAYMNLGSIGLAGNSYDNPVAGIHSNSEFIDYDASFFPKTPLEKIEKMVHITHEGGSTFVAVPIKEGSIKAGVSYTVSFDYHFNQSDFSTDDVHLAIFYLNANKGYGTYYNNFVKVVGEKPGVSLANDAKTKYRDGARAEYTFVFDKVELETCGNKMYLGFNMDESELHANFYVHDIKIYETKDETKTSLLMTDKYSEEATDWVGAYGDYNMDSKRKIVDYDPTIFVPTSEENLYVDVTFRGDDGEWWKPGDLQTEAIETATVKGRVTNQDGKPIANVKLILKGGQYVQSAITDINGYYSFIDIPVDMYELFIIDDYGCLISSGYTNFFSDGDIATIDFVCDSSKTVFTTVGEDLGIIKGTVYSADLKTVSGLKVYMRNVGEVTTDSEGNFEFADVPVGEYEIYTILDDGSEYVFRTVVVEPNVELAVKLKYDPQTENSTNFIIWIIIAAGAVLVVGAGITIFIILKRKKAKI